LQIPTILPNYSNFYRACQGIFARDNLQSFYLFLFILTKNSLFFRSKRAKLGILTVTIDYTHPARTRLAQTHPAHSHLARTRPTACALLELALLKLALLKLTLPHVPCSHSSYRMRLARTHLTACALLALTFPHEPFQKINPRNFANRAGIYKQIVVFLINRLFYQEITHAVGLYCSFLSPFG
jgi:hypothetical protein